MTAQTIFPRAMPNSLTRLVVDFSGTTSSLIAAVTGSQIIVVKYKFALSVATTIQWKSGSTALTGAMTIAAETDETNFLGGVGSVKTYSLIESYLSQDINIVLGTSCQISGFIDYYTDLPRS